MAIAAQNSAKGITDHIVESVRRADARTEPFFHLILDGVFPDDTYAAMINSMLSSASQGASRAAQYQHPGGWNVDARQGRSVPRAPPSSDGRTESPVDECRARALRTRSQGRLRRAIGAGAGASLRRRLPVGWPFSYPDADPRHLRVPYPRAYGHALEGHNSPALPAARLVARWYWHGIQSAAQERQIPSRESDVIRTQPRLCFCRR